MVTKKLDGLQNSLLDSEKEFQIPKLQIIRSFWVKKFTFLVIFGTYNTLFKTKGTWTIVASKIDPTYAINMEGDTIINHQFSILV